ncbi:LysR family transcriptional regulator [Sulfitobacter sp. F26204]|uniref:LysR family transcriptional regulator n=1 Tax=Sulfitobacter sp. F26204 TaxID=2996014 RepID=UPI00225DDFFF|nr:LysR family transcriptional regulator [Sulfitobacter sp. F26204]MCX7558454.1 LysR family transcriptional regulator [Sulfitobacter sp. F26204]
MSLDWNDLKVALAVKRSGSIARAAVQLDLDQSTVSRRLSALETALGTTLFKRSKSGLQLTEVGERLLPLALKAERSIDHITEQACEEEKGPSGLVRILSNAWILDRLTEKVMPGFLDAFPGISVRLLFKESDVPVQSDATVSLWFEAPPRHGDIAEPLGAVPFALYCHKDIEERTLDWVSFFDEDSPKRAPVHFLEKHRAEQEQIRVTALDAQLVRTAVRAGIGKGFLPMCLGENDPGLKRISGHQPAFFRVLHLHAHPDTRQTHRTQAIIATLRESFESGFLL